MTPFLTVLAKHPIIPLFLLTNLAIGFWAHRKAKANSFEDYALASGGLPTGVLILTLLATLLTMSDLSKVGFSDQVGVLMFGNSIVYLISFGLIGTFVAPYLVHFHGCHTLGDLAHRMYGTGARIFTGIISCVICLLVIVPQMQAIATLGESIFHISPNTTILWFGGTIVLYSMWGGMRSVSYTDVFQAIAALVAISWVMHIVLQKVGGIEKVFEGLSEEKMRFVSHPKFLTRAKKLIFWRLIPVYMFTPPIMQRMLMAQDKRQVRKMWYATAVLYAIILSMFILIGLVFSSNQHMFPVASGGMRSLFLRILKYLFADQPLTLDLLCIGLLAIGISTIDSFLHAMGILITQDIIVPVKEQLKMKPLHERQKLTYARISIAMTGILSVLITLMMGSHPANSDVIEYSVLIYAIAIIPLIIGIMGIKTDKASWGSFSIVYSASMVVLKLKGWHIYDYFLVSLPLGILAYFASHIYRNRGILILKRSKQTISEQLWMPTWQGMIQYVTSWIKAPLQLPTLASRKIVNNPTHSLSFSMLIFFLYTFSSIMTGGNNDLGLANFMAGIHLVGITLCAGLMLEGIWPAKLKPYFALYWFFTLFYCLAFGSTLTFLRVHGDSIAVGKWIVSFILLVTLVDSISFFTLSCLGSGLAMALWYALFGSLPADLLESIGLPGAYLLVGLLVTVVLFKSSKEQYTSQRFDWNRTASSALGHDLRLAVGMLGGTGRALSNAFKVSESMTNTKGEKGYWIPESQATFLENFSEKMIERGEMAGKEIQDFSDFIKSQVVGIFEQEKSNMHKAAEEAIHKLKDKMPSTFKMTISGGKDFSPKVLSGIFKNVFYNLLWNAATHGKASKVDITIDEVKRTVTVRDNGKGIPSDVLPRIFDLNFSTEMKQSKNSGVGLAFVKMVVLASSGKISCHSRHGDKNSFTEFVMEFPEA